jgi:hypothetical protein
LPPMSTRCSQVMALSSLTLQLRLWACELSAPVIGLGDGLVGSSPEGPSQDEAGCRRVSAEREPRDQAADLRNAEGHEELAGGSLPPLAASSMARRPARNARASMARVMWRCQPCQLLTS